MGKEYVTAETEKRSSYNLQCQHFFDWKGTSGGGETGVKLTWGVAQLVMEKKAASGHRHGRRRRKMKLFFQAGGGGGEVTEETSTGGKGTRKLMAHIRDSKRIRLIGQRDRGRKDQSHLYRKSIARGKHGGRKAELEKKRRSRKESQSHPGGKQREHASP